MEGKVISKIFEIDKYGLKATGFTISVINEDKLRESIGELVRIAALDSGVRAAWAQYVIHQCALQLGIFPASIHDLYVARGKGAIPPTFTTPAINLRALSYDCARAAFRSARKINSALLIFEIARVELIWGGITLAEYAACVYGAAIAERYKGVVFLQCDHFQVAAQLPLASEESVLKDLILHAIKSGFYNIDIDTSTLVDLSKESVDEQQLVNARVSAALAAFIRISQHPGVTISIGGEIGEVGGHISTVEELHSYMTQFNEFFSSTCPEQPGLSKISIHSGTTHGGNALPDGTIARPAIAFETIQKLGVIGQQFFGLGGVVQHGASTLPLEDFQQLVNCGTLEVHLATAFMTTLLERLPASLIKKMHAWLNLNYGHERTPEMTDAQFYHRFEMHALEPYKKALWDLPTSVKERIYKALEIQFDNIFTRLGCTNSYNMVHKHIKQVITEPVFESSSASTEVNQAPNGLAG